MTALKTGLLGVFLMAALLPLAHVNAWAGNGYEGNFFFPHNTGYGAPREELIVYAWGPGTTAQSPFNNYQPSYAQPNYYQPAYQPTYYQQPMYQPAYYYEPQYYQPTYFNYDPYYQQSYDPYSYGSSYGYPTQNYDYNQPQQPYFGYSPEPTGGTDFWGNDLCNWGAGYGGYPCDRDPHQWIYDPWTGSWY